MQEEYQMKSGEEKMGGYENQAITSNSKKGNTNKEHHYQKKIRRPKKRDYSQFRCFTCDLKWHHVKDCPQKKGNKKRYHAHTTKDDETIKKRDREDSSSDE